MSPQPVCCVCGQSPLVRWAPPLCKTCADQASDPWRGNTHYQNIRAAGKLGRAAMPAAEANDTEAGDGARRKTPVRYE